MNRRAFLLGSASTAVVCAVAPALDASAIFVGIDGGSGSSWTAVAYWRGDFAHRRFSEMLTLAERGNKEALAGITQAAGDLIDCAREFTRGAA